MKREIKLSLGLIFSIVMIGAAIHSAQSSSGDHFRYKEGKVSELKPELKSYIDKIRKSARDGQKSVETPEMKIGASDANYPIQIIRLLEPQDCDGAYFTNIVLINNTPKFSLEGVSEVIFYRDLCSTSKPKPSTGFQQLDFVPCLTFERKNKAAFAIISGEVLHFKFGD